MTLRSIYAYHADEKPDFQPRPNRLHTDARVFICGEIGAGNFEVVMSVRWKSVKLKGNNVFLKPGEFFHVRLGMRTYYVGAVNGGLTVECVPDAFDKPQHVTAEASPMGVTLSFGDEEVSHV